LENIKFNARIIEKGNNEKGKFVVLDKNEFYPDGKGGQLGDRGRIGKANIAFSEEKGGKVLIYVDSFPEDDVVLCEINRNRRHTISSLHTAQHILSAVLEDMFKVKTVSFHMSEDNCTIDVTPTISENKIFIAEDAVNESVFRNLPVKNYFVNEKELSRINPRSMHEVHGKIRIVEIPGVDVSLCGGTHVDFTGEVGLIKILKIEKVKK
jgi:alanyl-tRNA synthetase